MIGWLALVLLIMSVAQPNVMMMRLLGVASNGCFIMAYSSDTVIVLSNIIVALIHCYHIARLGYNARASPCSKAT